MPMWRTRPAVVGPIEYTADQPELKAAYERGRHDERHSRQHHPFIALGVVVLAIAGAWLLFLAAREGSFARGGVAADQNLTTAAQEAKPVLRQTGEAIKDAGVTLKDKSQDLIKPDAAK